MGKKSKIRVIKRRNPYGLIASLRTGSGRHPDEKKEANKQACRKPVEREE